MDVFDIKIAKSERPLSPERGLDESVQSNNSNYLPGEVNDKVYEASNQAMVTSRNFSE